MNQTQNRENFFIKWAIFRAWKSWRDFFNKIGFQPLTALIAASLSFFSALADGASIGLLIPTLQGMVEKSFYFIYKTPVLKNIVTLLPVDFPKKNIIIFSFLILLIFISAITKNVLWYFSCLITSWQIMGLANKVRKLVYARYLSFGKMFFDRASSGHLHQVLTGYTQQVAQELSAFQDSVFQFCSLVIYGGMAFCISWKLALFSCIVFPFMHYSFRFIIKKIKRTSDHFAEVYSEMGTKISNALSCMMLIKAYKTEEREKQWFCYTSDRVRHLQFSIQKKQLLVYPFQDTAGLCMMLLLTGFMAFLLVPGDSRQLAGFLVFFVVLRKASQNFGVFNRLQSALAGIRGPLREIQNILDDREKFFVPEGRITFSGLKEKIEFKNLSFSYEENSTALRQLNFTIAKGETVAVVGASGSGKTTLVHLLMRFYDTAPGTLLIDGTDIREFTLASLLGKMVLVSQDALLLNAPFKINLLYGLDREVSEKEIENVLDRSRLTSLVQHIGLEASIGDRGVQLSGGERQRLSIARAILKNPEILILDEATSALDATTEQLVQEAIEEVMVGKTVLMIAHRLATVRKANRIMVLEKGEKIEEGTFRELLSNKEGSFYFYWTHQKLGRED